MNEHLVIIAGAVVVVLLALAAMAAMHERHYKDRRTRLFAARLAAIEEIVCEDRLT